jgi:tetratricopeptide (TPR) repeat protein
MPKDKRQELNDAVERWQAGKASEYDCKIILNVLQARGVNFGQSNQTRDSGFNLGKTNLQFQNADQAQAFLFHLQQYLLPKPPQPNELPEVGNLPSGSRLLFHRNAVFTGREDELIALSQSLLFDGHGAVVSGTGGMGKSQLAVEFCYRYGRYFRGVHWLQAQQDMLAEIAACGISMDLKPWSETVPVQAQNVINVWEQGGSRLVVLDDAEDPSVVQEWLPRLGNSSVLVTSRWGDWPADLGFELCELETLPRLKSLDLLRKLAPELERAPDKELSDIADRLGDLPLALDLAGCYLNDKRTLNPNGFLEELDKAGSVLEHSALKDWVKHNPTKNEMNLAKTFIQSWNKLESETAKDLLRVCGYCAPNTPIPWKVLEWSVEVEGDEMDHALGRLEDLGLVSLGETGTVFHPLLAEFTRLQDEESEESVLPRLVSALGDLSKSARWTNKPVDFTSLSAHMEAAAETAQEAGLEGAGTLWFNLGWLLNDVAEYEGAKAAYERALVINEAELGPDHPDLSRYINNLGVVLMDLGDLEGAKAAFERALAIDEAELDFDHADVAGDVTNLGGVLRSLGDYEGAKAAYERALAIDEAIFGPDHPRVASDINNLGGVMVDHDDYVGAKAAYERALAIDEAAFGPDHPNVASRVNNLGGVLDKQGDYAGAKAAFERALAIDEAAFGPDHPNVASRVYNLGGVLDEQGDYAGAKAAIERALAIDEAAFGPDSLNVASRVYRLGVVLNHQGDYAGAKEAFERALAILEKVYPENPHYIKDIRWKLENLEEKF